MNRTGITRVVITDEIRGSGAWRFVEARKRWPAANKLYRQVFDCIGMPLCPDEREMQCSKEEFVAGYDYALGIDVILEFDIGMEATLQEKFLFTSFKTVTVEYYQNPDTRELGDWFRMRAQYYFVGYDRNKALDFQDWILLDWPATMRATAQRRIHWLDRTNAQDGARATFRYAGFEQFPPDCVVASSDKKFQPVPQFSLS